MLTVLVALVVSTVLFLAWMGFLFLIADDGWQVLKSAVKSALSRPFYKRWRKDNYSDFNGYYVCRMCNRMIGRDSRKWLVSHYEHCHKQRSEKEFREAERLHREASNDLIRHLHQAHGAPHSTSNPTTATDMRDA